MSLTNIEKSFIENWKKIDFSDWNENDIREDFIAPLLRILGYSKNTLNNINREQTLRLNEPYQRIGRKRIDIDYIPTFKLKSFWVIEAKSGITREMDFGDFSQAYLYANHPEVRSYYIVLINGWEIRIYDAKESSDWGDTLIVSNQSNCDSTFIALKNLLSSNKIIQTLRKRIITSIEDTFSVEIEKIKLDQFQIDLQRILTNLKKIVIKNAREFQIKTDQELDEQTKSQIEKASINELLGLMNIPIFNRPFAAEEYVRRIKNSDKNERINLILELIKKRNLVMEINTGGLRKDCKEQYPSEIIINEMYSLDIPILLGSDAHSPEVIAWKFEKMIKMLKRIGYNHLAHFNKREMTSIEI